MTRHTEKKDQADEFYQAILLLKDAEECRNFFMDVCSPAERCAMEQRYSVARMLTEGRTYLSIQDATKASTATISRVRRTLSDGTGAIGSLIERAGEKGETK